LLSSIAQLSLRRELLIVGQIPSRTGDQRVDVLGASAWLARLERSGRGRRGLDADRGLRSSEQRCHRRFGRRPVSEASLHGEPDQSQLRHRTVLRLEVNWLRIEQGEADRYGNQ